MTELSYWLIKVGICADEYLRSFYPVTSVIMNRENFSSRVELLIIDEAERLTAIALELLRDHHDHTHLAMILFGVPGSDQRFRHYPQPYSRFGFSRHYRTVCREELLFHLNRHWKSFGKPLDPDDFTDARAIAVIEAAASILVIRN